MRRWYLVPVACAFGLIGLLIWSGDVQSAGEKSAKPRTVAMHSLSFHPKVLQLHTGDSVVWANQSRTIHTATSNDDGKAFDTGEVQPGQSSQAVRFDAAGEFPYHCKVHGKTMSGTIIVKAAGGR